MADPEEANVVAMGQSQAMVEELNPYAAGFEWDPFSPNTDVLSHLRTPEVFRKYAEMLKYFAPDKIRIVKMAPYEDDADQRREWFALVDAWLEGGGHGIAAVNTRKVSRDQIASKDWGYPSAGESGKPLGPYRRRAVKETRERYPEAVIYASGGIFTGDDAYETFKLGANALESLTPEAIYGFGLLRNKMRRVSQRLRQDGYQNLQELQLEVRKGKKLLCDV